MLSFSLLWPYVTTACLLAEICSRFAASRFLFREAVRLLTEFDLGCMWALQKVIKPSYEIRGSCDKRGVCCKHIIGDPPRFIKKSFLLRLYAGYHAAMHRFAVVARGPNDELIFACGHLQTDGRCGIYRYRPRLCRHYPILPFFGMPKLLPGCGYTVVPRAVSRMQKRRSLPIVNPQVAVHHPTAPQRPAAELERPEDYHLVEVAPPSSPP
jgi:hypothetical protein